MRNLIIEGSTSSLTSIEWISKGNGASGLGGYPNSRGWRAYAVGNDWSPPDQSNDFRIGYWNGSTWVFGLVVDRATGNVGIRGIMNPSHPLHMLSGAYCSTGGAWINASSREGKQDISNLSTQEAVVALSTLNPVRFRYEAEQDEEYLGFIADDVPDLLTTKDRNGLSAMDIVAVLTKVVQEQQNTIAELSKRIAALESLQKQ